MACEDLKTIQAEKIKRALTGFQELDWIYGCTEINGKTYWGMPASRISLFSGVSGVGKSRVSVELAKSLARRGYRILYFQNEENLASFAARVKNGYDQTAGKFLCSDSSDLATQIETIWETSPDFIFVDSVNEMDDFNSGTKMDIKKIFEAYREVTKKHACHVVFLTQLNQDGSIKGSTTLAHLADIALNIVPCDKKGSSLFEIKVGIKHRYGRKSAKIFSRWEHTADGVQCISDYSLEDELWCNTHGIPVRDMKEYYDNLDVEAPNGETINIFSQEEGRPNSSLWQDLREVLFGPKKNIE